MQAYTGLCLRIVMPALARPSNARTGLFLPFGMSPENQRLYAPSEAKEGSIACVCPGCSHPLVAKCGKVRVHHFAHANGSDCATGRETALHLAAKQVITDERGIYLPALSAPGAAAGLQRLSKVELEKAIGAIRPDALVELKSGLTVAVEIKVRHAVDAQKRAKLNAMGLPAVEFDLSAFAAKSKEAFSWERLRELLLTHKAPVRLLHHPELETAPAAVRPVVPSQPPVVPSQPLAAATSDTPSHAEKVCPTGLEWAPCADWPTLRAVRQKMEDHAIGQMEPHLSDKLEQWLNTIIKSPPRYLSAWFGPVVGPTLIDFMKSVGYLRPTAGWHPSHTPLH